MPYAGSEFLPPGLTVINDFITAEEEEELLATLDWTNAESGQLFSSYLCCSDDDGSYPYVIEM